MAAAAVLKPIPPTSLPDATSSSSLSSFPVLPPLISRLPPALLASPSTPVPTPAPSVGYTESHLPAVDEASLALHHALHKFHVIDVEHYANAPYDQAFNWSELKLPEEVVREW